MTSSHRPGHHGAVYAPLLADETDDAATASTSRTRCNSSPRGSSHLLLHDGPPTSAGHLHDDAHCFPFGSLTDSNGDNPYSDIADPVPVDWARVFPLFLLRATDAMAYAVIYPFITEYITSLGTPLDVIGLYAGMAEAGLMITQAAMAPVWAWLADRYGRKRCVMYGFTGTVMSASMTGFGRSVWWIIFWRAMFGLSPSDVVHRIMLTERSHQSNRPRIFSLWSPIFNIGFVCGQLIGGFLASPHGRLPWIMGGQVETWKKWPYGLPCVVVDTLGLIALIVCKYMIEDDVPLALNQTGLRVSNNLQARVRATLRIPFFVRSLTVYCAFQIAVYAHTGFLTVMSYTSIEHGGWGLSVASIGVLTSCLRTTYMLSTPLLLPHFVRRFSLRRRFRIALSALPLESLLIPISQLAARQSVHGQGSGEGRVRKPHRFWFWVVMLVEVPLYNLHMFAWPMNDNLNTDCFDNYPALIATGSAITQITGAIGRATGPVLSGWLFSYSTQFDTNSLGRQISWMTLFCITFPSFLLSGIVLPRTLKEAKDASATETVERVAGESRKSEDEEGEDGDEGTALLGSDQDEFGGGAGGQDADEGEGEGAASTQTRLRG